MAHHEKSACEIIFNPLVSIITDEHAGLFRVITDFVNEFKADSNRDYRKASEKQVAVEKELHLLLVQNLIVPKAIDMHHSRNLFPIYKVIKPVERKIENLLAANKNAQEAENWRI